MKTFRRVFLSLLLVSLWSALQAQVPPDVVNVVKKCSEKMKNPAGVEMVCTLNVKAMAVISVNGTLKMYTKGDKSLAKTCITVLGHEVRTESGSDGTQDWFLKPASGDGEKDTVYLVSGKKKDKDEFDLDFNLYNEYKKAKMKESNGRYEITFSSPKDKDMPSKTILVVNKDDYLFHSMTVKDGAKGFTMTATRIKFGVDDGLFVFSAKRYPNAVVVKRDDIR